MKIILLRHGTRNFGTGDIPLNEDGLEEAQELAQDSRLHDVKKALSSPKKRAQMTLAPLVEKLNLEMEISPLFDQRASHENGKEFVARVRTAITKLEKLAEEFENVIVCSHSDWLTTAVEVIPSDITEPETILFQCAEYLTFEIREGLWHKI